MMTLSLADAILHIPQPLFLVVEDVGWWQGGNGSAVGEPYRNAFPRRHCLDDYKALARLAARLSMRIAVGMVLGEWDRSDLLKTVPGATWMGVAWDNRNNRGPWLDEAADYLGAHSDLLEIALHGLCHEFWQDGVMLRSEFHDEDNRMRAEDLVRSHLEAYWALLAENSLPENPRLFVPPALYHSFGNGDDSIQAILHDFGIDRVTTRFCRARRYTEPIHPNLTWECGVGILERGLSPVEWNVPAAAPAGNDPGPVVALHWGNLLHPDPRRNLEIVDAWAEHLATQCAGAHRILAPDLAFCWRQAAACFLARMAREQDRAIIDLSALPDIACLQGEFAVKIEEKRPGSWQCLGAQIVADTFDGDGIRTLTLRPDKRRDIIVLSR